MSKRSAPKLVHGPHKQPPDWFGCMVPRPMLKRLATDPLTADLYGIGFGYFPCARGHWVRRFENRDWILIYCTAGRGWAESDEIHYEIGPGDLCVLEQDKPHAYGTSEDDPWSILWLHCTGRLAREHMAAMAGDPIAVKLELGLKPPLIAEFEQFFTLREGTFEWPQLVHAANHLRTLLSYIALARGARQADATPRLNLARLELLIENNLHGTLTLEQMAAAAGMSRFHFARVFRALKGSPPLDYFLRRKIRRACELLDGTRQTIYQVADAVGFADPFYFSRAFKKVMGCSPRAYRQIVKG